MSTRPDADAQAPAPPSSIGSSNQQSARSRMASATTDGPISLRPGEDAEREAALRTMKAWATGLLVKRAA